ncbi:hypothetical protein BKA61DRAFT_530072, partial [Leptodontidium sp. MPI-SDFR-AT-0119]
MLTLLLLSCLSTHFSSAAPISDSSTPSNATTPANTTASSTAIASSWVSEPQGRGTWNLLYSCVFTLVLCVWTSVHLNVPGFGETTWQMYRRKAKWVLIALFAPEFVVYCAFQQWFTARMFLTELQKLHDWVPPGLEGKDGSRKKHKFDMTYAMFAVMGGFIVDIEHLHNRLKRATLTMNGLLLLAQHGHFFYVEAEAIADKSKANILAKGLVCVQVLWVAGQTIERKAVGLPISILEFHTLVHVVCALVMYVLWFQKPYDIQYPSLVGTGDFPETLAFIVASSEWRGCSGFTSNLPKAWVERFLPSDYLDEDPNFTWYGSLNSSAINFSADGNDNSSTSHPQDGTSEDYWYQAVPYSYIERRTPGRRKLVYSPVQETSPAFSLSYGQALCSGLGPGHPSPKNYQKIIISDKDKIRLDLAGDSASVGLFVALILVLSAYGAIHLAAGHTMFPTSVELTLWRSSCYILLGGAGLVLLLVAVSVFISSGLMEDVDFPNWLENT